MICFINQQLNLKTKTISPTHNDQYCCELQLYITARHAECVHMFSYFRSNMRFGKCMMFDEAFMLDKYVYLINTMCIMFAK